MIGRVASQTPAAAGFRGRRRLSLAIPVVADFKNKLGIDTLLIGLGLNNDRIHAPNEKFNLDNFTLGCRTHAAVLAELAGVKQ